MSLQTTSLHRSSQTSTPFFYKGKVENMVLDGKLEDVFCARLDKVDPEQTASLIRDAQALKALFTDPGAQAAIKEAEEHRFSDMTVDLGNGPQEFSVTKMPSGDFRIVNSNDPGYDVHAQVILMQGGEHAHYAILSTQMQETRNDPALVQSIKMSFTKSQNFLVDSETIHVGSARQEAMAPHIPAWDHNPLFKDVKPFR